MLLANMAAEKNMNNNCNQTSSTKIDRKIVEKNRRNQMKILYSELYSLIPNHNSNNQQEAIPVPDQIDEAINHIKSSEERLKKLKEKKERYLLMGKKRSYDENKTRLKLPQIEVYEMAGSLLEVVLKTGLDYQFIFSEVVCILREEHADVANVKLSVSGDSVFHVLHAEIRDPAFGLIGAAKISERLKNLVSGSTCSDIQVDFQPDNLCDFDIQPQLWQL